MTRTREEYEAALVWVWNELDAAARAPACTKETLIANLRDRVGAALERGPYTSRDDGQPVLRVERHEPPRLIDPAVAFEMKISAYLLAPPVVGPRWSGSPSPLDRFVPDEGHPDKVTYAEVAVHVNNVLGTDLTTGEAMAFHDGYRGIALPEDVAQGAQKDAIREFHALGVKLQGLFRQ